jgi:hypothetical protein
MGKVQVTQEELTKIQELNADFNKAKMAVADAELQKHAMIRIIDELKVQFSLHEKLLIEKYGKDAVINIQTGEVTQKEN